MNTGAPGTKAVPLFALLSASDRAAVTRLAQEQSIGARKLIIKENAPFSGLHIIKTGSVKLCKMHGDKEQILELVLAGDVIDPIPLFDHGAHAITAKTLTPTTVYRFSPELAQQLLASYPPVLNALLNVVSARLRKLATLANDLAFKDVTARVCNVLLQYATSERGMTFTPTMTRNDLAAMVGTAREVAWRALKKLERDGLIEIHGQQIVIVDPAGLASRA